ncbi:hypothetical protein BX600DRAFT_442877 [Xylariales sp. PMI_506]|nr:hypothetical protein BX600DRAFT_442877 [Xylariales sp. PMI_506]
MGTKVVPSLHNAVGSNLHDLGGRFDNPAARLAIAAKTPRSIHQSARDKGGFIQTAGTHLKSWEYSQLPEPLDMILREKARIPGKQYFLAVLGENGVVTYFCSPTKFRNDLIAELFNEEKFRSCWAQSTSTACVTSNPLDPRSDSGIVNDVLASTKYKDQKLSCDGTLSVNRPASHWNSSRYVRDSNGYDEIVASMPARKRQRANLARRVTDLGDGDIPPPPVKEKVSIMIGDSERIWEFYEQRFKNCQQKACKLIAKAWIKVIEPKKQSTHPYTGKDEKAPEWWPQRWGDGKDDKVRHKEPDHLYKRERVHLLNHILRMVIEPSERQHRDIRKLKLNTTKLKEITLEALSGFFTDKDNPSNRLKKPFLLEIFKIALFEERFRAGLIAPTCKVYIFPNEVISDSDDDLARQDPTFKSKGIGKWLQQQIDEFKDNRDDIHIEIVSPASESIKGSSVAATIGTMVHDQTTSTAAAEILKYAQETTELRRSSINNGEFDGKKDDTVSELPSSNVLSPSESSRWGSQGSNSVLSDSIWIDTPSEHFTLRPDHAFLAVEQLAVKEIIFTYQEWSREVRLTQAVVRGQPTGNNPGPPPSESSGAYPSQTGFPPTPKSNSSKGKRVGKRHPDEDDHHQQPPMKRGRKYVEKGEKRLACPFQKRYPSKHLLCGARGASPGFDNISHIKDHLRRRHIRYANYCPKCKIKFNDSEARDQHILQAMETGSQPCEYRPFPDETALPWNEQVRKTLESRVDKTLALHAQWFSLWDQIFEGVPRPPTCTVDDDLCEHVIEYHEFCVTRGAEVIRRVIAQHNLLATVLDDQAQTAADLEAFAERVFELAAPEVFAYWRSQKRTQTGPHRQGPLHLANQQHLTSAPTEATTTTAAVLGTLELVTEPVSSLIDSFRTEAFPSLTDKSTFTPEIDIGITYSRGIDSTVNNMGDILSNNGFQPLEYSGFDIDHVFSGNGLC